MELINGQAFCHSRSTGSRSRFSFESLNLTRVMNDVAIPSPPSPSLEERTPSLEGPPSQSASVCLRFHSTRHMCSDKPRWLLSSPACSSNYPQALCLRTRLRANYKTQ